MKVEIGRYEVDYARGRVKAHVLVNGKKKYWNMPKGLFLVLFYLTHRKERRG